MNNKFSWTDVEDIGLELYEKYPDRNPLEVRFTELRDLVKSLDDFEPAEGQVVNEKILEHIQKYWYEEYLENQD